MNKILSSLLFFCLVNTVSLPAKTWSELIKQYAYLMSTSELSSITKKQELFDAGKSPTIASPEIKKIPIIEQGEELVDVRTIKHSRIEMLPDPKYPFESPDYNSGLPSASKIRLTIMQRLENLLEHIDNLASDFNYEKGQITIKVFEGLRDLATQAALFNAKVNEILSNNLTLTFEQAEAEACKWVSPVKNNIPVHSTGAAVDIRLWDNKNNDFIDMGKFGVIWGPNEAVVTFSEKISDEQKKNRLFLLLAAERAGLTNYAYEYWHLSAKDRYAEYWQEKNDDEKCASYGPAMVR